jgi:hypothetical protein
LGFGGIGKAIRAKELLVQVSDVGLSVAQALFLQVFVSTPREVEV